MAWINFRSPPTAEDAAEPAPRNERRFRAAVEGAFRRADEAVDRLFGQIVTKFTSLSDTPSDYGTAGYALYTDGAGNIYYAAAGGGGATAFTGLSDTPAGYGVAGQAVLTDGVGALYYSTLPTVITDHGGLSGLADDDHTQYVLADGTRKVTGELRIGDWDTAGFSLFNLAGNSAQVQINAAGELRLKAYNDGQVYYGGTGGPATASAGSTILSRTMGDARYLTITDAAATYLTIANASSTYLTQANAAATYLTISTAASTYLPLAGGTMTGILNLLDPGDVNNTMFEGGNGPRQVRLFHSASTNSNYIGFIPRNSGDTGYLFTQRLAWDVALQKWCIGTDYIATKASLSSLVDAFQTEGVITAGQATNIKATL